MSFFSDLKDSFVSSFKNNASSAVGSLWNSGSGKELSGVSDLTSNAPVNDVNPGSVTQYDEPVAYYVTDDAPGKSSWKNLLGAALGGVGSIVGGLLNYKQQKEANKIAQQQFAENLAFQKDQFYNAIQYRVADAIKAGVHPLAALGISAHGSASPTAHVQAATGLGSAVQNTAAIVNSFFENAIKSATLDEISSRVVANRALAVKYSADAGRQVAETAYTNKDLNNYHLYRVWNSINSSIGAITGGIRAGAAIRASGRPINRYFGDMYITN